MYQTNDQKPTRPGKKPALGERLAHHIYIHPFIKALFLFIIVGTTACSPQIRLSAVPQPANPVTGSEFYKQALTMQWKERDSLAASLILQGNLPPFLKKLVPVKITLKDSLTAHALHATVFVTPDYLSVGAAADWARIPLTPMTAQRIADAFGCFLPTKKLVDDIYQAARVKLDPVPLYVYRDSSVTFWQHHLIIEGQRKGQKGLIAGIKKDVVISEALKKGPRPNRVAIYGWHRSGGQPIQPLYTGHVNWYVDYSHGIRLVYRKIKVNGKWMDYADIMKDKNLQGLLCDAGDCGCLGY